MAQPVFFMRGFPLGEDPSSSKQMLDDLKLIAQLQPQVLRLVSERLTKAEGFLAPAALRETLTELGGSADIAEAIERALRAVDPEDIEKFFGLVKRLVQEEEQAFGPQQMESLEENMALLIRSYPALVRYRKAVRLAQVTGNALESVDLICDLRPIFDEDRRKVEGMMPYTRLHLVATGEDGLPKCFEAELAWEDVCNLAEKAEKAKQKLQALKDFIEAHLPNGLPDLRLTRVPDEDSSNA